MEAKDLLDKLEEYAGVDFRAHRKIAEEVVADYTTEIQLLARGEVMPLLYDMHVAKNKAEGLPSSADLDAVAAEDEIKEKS